MAVDPNSESKAPGLEEIDNDMELLSNSNAATSTTITDDIPPIDGNPNIDSKPNTGDVFHEFDDELQAELTCKISYCIQNKYWSGNGRITGCVCPHYIYLYMPIYPYNLYCKHIDHIRTL